MILIKNLMNFWIKITKENIYKTKIDVFRDFYTIWTEKLFSEPEKETEKDSVKESDEHQEKDPDVGIIITKDNEEMIIHVKVPGFKKEDFNIFKKKMKKNIKNIWD